MPRLKPDSSEYVEGMWREWTAICQQKIHELAINEFVILLVDDANNVFIQIARSEAGNNCDLVVEASPGENASAGVLKSMLEIGWEPPGSYVENGGANPNYQVLWRSTPECGRVSTTDSEEAAILIATTLRLTFAVADPREIPVERDNF